MLYVDLEDELRSTLKKTLQGFTGQSIPVIPSLSEQLDILLIPARAQAKEQPANVKVVEHVAFKISELAFRCNDITFGTSFTFITFTYLIGIEKD